MKNFMTSQQVLNSLANKFGSADYSNWQSIRKQFWSYLDYPVAGQSSFSFFGSAEGENGSSASKSNMPKGGSFGQNHFLLKAIRCKIWTSDPETDSWDGTDAETLYSDFINGFLQAGVLTLSIQNKEYVQVPKPFLYMGAADGPTELRTAGIEALTLTEGTPNTLNTYRTSAPYASLKDKEQGLYVVDPNILIEAEQNFGVKIEYDNGALAPIATGIIDGTNVFRIGVELDGIVFRPLQ